MKNRYGSTNEIGVFDMGEDGLTQVENPSQAMLSGRPQNVSGSCVTAVMEGTRPILAEIQDWPPPQAMEHRAGCPLGLITTGCL